MKKFTLLTVAIAVALVMACCSKADNTIDYFATLPELPDPTDVCSAMDDSEFVRFCTERFDADHDGKISKAEAVGVKELDCDDSAIGSFKGVEYFVALQRFSCKSNHEVRVIDLRHNKRLTKIAANAFAGCSNLQSVVIPDSAKSIDVWAFAYCGSLTDVVIPDGVGSIGQCAFSCCDGLASITLPASVKSIGESAFFLCKGLTNIAIPDGVRSIGKIAFACCEGLTSITIPEGVTAISDGVLSHCTALASVTIPDSAKSIGEEAFGGCKSLTSITIPQGVASVGDGAFRDCDGLVRIYCKRATPPTLGENVFYNNPSDAQIYVPRASVEAYKAADGWSDYAAKIVGYDF